METAIPADDELEIFNGTFFIDNFLEYTTSWNHEILLLSLGNDHLYRASNYS